MKLSRPPRLFGSNAKTADIMDNNKDCDDGACSKDLGSADKDGNSGSKSKTATTTKNTTQKNQFRKSPLAALKSKLKSRSSGATNADLKRDASKRSNETTSPENSHLLEEEEVEEVADDKQQPLEQQQDHDDADTVSVEQEKDPLVPTTLASPRRRSRLGAPKSLFQPPHEVMIDPHAVPPSPMKDPAFHMIPRTTMIMDQQQQQPSPYPGLLMNVMGSSNNDDNAQPYCLGDPLGDIAMKRQLLDAQRLVRLILGKPLCGDQQLLETTTILQAIRSFAMMKQELVDLRKKQEVVDGDPPAILQTLGSPVGTTPSSVATGLQTDTPSTAFSFRATGQDKQEEANDEVEVSRDLAPSQPATLDEANAKIESLQQQLAAANEMIRSMQQEENEHPATAMAPPGLSLEDCEQQDCCKIRQTIEIKYQRLVTVHKAAVEESQRNLDAVIDSVASVPKRVLAKDSVREKLKAYCTTITNHASQLQVVEMEERIQREREESLRIIQELQAKIKSQEERSGGKLEDRGNDPSATSATDIEQNSITLDLQEEKKVDA